jgi:hypothetical protein
MLEMFKRRRPERTLAAEDGKPPQP